MSTDPFEKAKESLGEAWKAARTAADGVKKEIERAGIAKSLDDAGREIVRAASSVATQFGAELEELGREIRLKTEGPSPPPGEAPGHAPERGPEGGRPAGPTAWGQPAPGTPPNPTAWGSAGAGGGIGGPPGGAPGYPVGEAYAPEPGKPPAKPEAGSAGPAEGGFRIAADDDPRS